MEFKTSWFIWLISLTFKRFTIEWKWNNELVHYKYNVGDTTSMTTGLHLKLGVHGKRYGAQRLTSLWCIWMALPFIDGKMLVLLRVPWSVSDDSGGAAAAVTMTGPLSSFWLAAASAHSPASSFSLEVLRSTGSGRVTESASAGQGDDPPASTPKPQMGSSKSEPHFLLKN